MVLRRAGGVVACVALGAACNAITGLDRDYQLGEGTLPVDSGSGRGDGTREDGDAPDAGGDSGGPGNVEAGTDAGAPLDCSKAPLETVFCSTFDVTTAPFGWGEVEDSGGVPTVDATAGRHGSPALHAKVTANGTSRSSNLWTTANLAWNDTQTLRMEFWFKIESASTYAVIGALDFNSREHGLSVYPAATDCSSGTPCLDENDQPVRGHNEANSFGYTPKQWYRAVVTLKRNGAAIGGSVSVDGVTVPLYAADSGAMPGPIPNTIRVGAGAFYSGETGTTEVYIDDVLVTLK